MSSIPAQHVIAVLTVALQFFVLSTDNLAGLSGADSIVRACLSSLDSSIGLILLDAIYTFVFEPPRDSRFRLKRLSLLHSQKEDLKEEIRLKIRPSWSRPFTNVTRIAVLSSASNEHTDHELQNSSVIFEHLKVMENLCQFVVPYMGRPKPDVPTTHTVRLSSSVLLDVAAKSFARYKSTVMTYSNQFKGITTFARTYPDDGPGGRTRPSWAPKLQSEFESKVLGYQYRFFPLALPATIIMWVANTIWPVGNKIIKRINKDLGRLSPELDDLLPDIGRRMFSRWAMPSDPEFTSPGPEGAKLLRLQIFEGDSIKDQLLAYTIIFKDVPALLVTEMQSPYMPREKLERWTWMIILTIGTTGVVAPFFFVLLHPHAGLQTYWLVEQLLVTVMKYGDVSNLLINTKFDGENPFEGPGAPGS
ncbi:MAG: hypothetical protein ASARMPREDX12_005560 [Alectoria sarmentosa]|nr:MAG: hypothetical protein ASARMPREDX12_005560 [Alectoria sarmentosa]